MRTAERHLSFNGSHRLLVFWMCCSPVNKKSVYSDSVVFLLKTPGNVSKRTEGLFFIPNSPFTMPEVCNLHQQHSEKPLKTGHK